MLLLTACSEETNATVDYTKVPVDENGNFIISGIASEDLVRFEINGQTFMPAQHLEDGSFMMDMNMGDEILNEVEFTIYRGTSILLEETIELDTSVYELALNAELTEEIEEDSDEETIQQDNEAEIDTDLEYINEELELYLSQNKGWALGTLDEYGNETTEGEPDPEYSNWLFVRSIEYTGSDIEVQVTADFQALSESEKELLASSAQGITQSYAATSSRPSIYFFNGENSLGGSKILNSTEYKWY